MEKYILLLCGFIMLMSSNINAQFQPGDNKMTFKSSYDGTIQPYRLFVPKTYYSSFPLLIVLHGKGVDENAWFDYTPVKEHAEKNGYVVAAPLGRGNYFYRGAAEQDVLDIIEDVKKKGNIDSSRIYIMGHSMGGWGTWWIGLRNPDVFAAICPMSGWAPPDFIENAEYLDPYMIHDADDPIVPVKNTRKTAALLSRNGISFRYKEEHGYGHASKMIGDNFVFLFDWLGKHKLNPSPERIKFLTRTPSKGRAYWLNIVETQEYPKIASIEAKVEKKDNLQTIKIKTQNVKRLSINFETCPVDIAKNFDIIIDETTLKSQQKMGKYLIFCLDAKSKVWREPKNEEETITDFRSPKLFDITKDSDMVSSPSLLTSAAAKILCEETNAEVCIFNPDMFMFVGGELTKDAVLDLFVYPDDRICIFEYKGEELPKFVNIQPEFFPTGKYNVAEDLKNGSRESFVTLTTVEIAEKMGVKFTPLPNVICEYLLKNLEKNKSFK